MLNEVHNIIKMIELVKQRPGIYDYTLDDHNNRPTVESLWGEVANEMGTTPADCRRKWASLRNALSRDLRNESEAAIIQRKKKKWYLAEHLSFLRTFSSARLKPPKNRGHGEETMDGEVDYTMEENKNHFDFSTQDYSAPDNSLTSLETPSGVVDIPKPATPENSKMEPRSQISRPRFTKKYKNAAPSPYERKHNCANDRQQEVPKPPPLHYTSESSSTNRINGDEKSIFDDRNMTFFKSIIPDILKLSNRKQRMYKQSVIMKLNRFLDEQET